jgi:formylmethanofuran dehydrogenase subunit A
MSLVVPSKSRGQSWAMPVSTHEAALFLPYERVMALMMSSKSRLKVAERIKKQVHLRRDVSGKFS